MRMCLCLCICAFKRLREPSVLHACWTSPRRLQEPSAENDAPLVLNFNSAVNDEKVSQSDVGSLIPGQQEGREHHPPPPAQGEAQSEAQGAV